MRVSRSRSVVSFGAMLLIGTALSSGAANAGTITCSNTITLVGGNGFVQDSSITAGTCVQTLDKLFGNFSISDLPAGGNIGFNVTNSGSPIVAHHGVAFNNNFPQNSVNQTFTASYAVAVSGSTDLIKELDADFTQSNGTSNLQTVTTELGVGSIDIQKTGSTGTGPDQINYSLGVVQLDVTNTLTDNGSISSILNTVVENAPAVGVPEPTSIALLGAAVVGLGTIRRRKSA
jgi:hypothetical protein